MTAAAEVLGRLAWVQFFRLNRTWVSCCASDFGLQQADRRWLRIKTGESGDGPSRFRQKQVSSKLEFIKIIRANECKDMFYVTFKANSVSPGEFQTYQIQVFYRPLTGNLDIDFEVLIFRPELEHFKQYVQDGDAPREDGDACGI